MNSLLFTLSVACCSVGGVYLIYLGARWLDENYGILQPVFDIFKDGLSGGCGEI